MTISIADAAALKRAALLAGGVAIAGLTAQNF
jgi:hypothetical protein